jgi:outer membrane protein, heavy metal efflux system
MYNLRLLQVGSILIFAGTGCISYKTKPLVPKAIFRDVETYRQSSRIFEIEELTFEKASVLMTENNPELEEIKTEYQKYQSIADIKTPLSNPSIEIGPDLGSNLGVGATNKNQPFIGFGFTIPLGGKRNKIDDINSANARKAFVEIQVKHRLLYLNLRESYTKLNLAYQKENIQKELVVSSEKMLKTAGSMRKIGVVSALDLGMIKLDGQKAKFELLEFGNELNEIYSKLSILLGVDTSKFRNIKSTSLPKIPNKEPAYDKLRSLLVSNHLGLAILRYEYEVAEKNLKYEISKQYPDIQFGTERVSEVGGKSTTLGLRLGIEIPLFDRNQQGIVFAKKEREHIRKKYISMVHDGLSELKKSYENIKVNLKKHQMLNGVIFKNANENLKIAKLSLQNGGIDTLKYLDVLRTYQQIRKDISILESEIRMSWIDLEKVVGYPVLTYPNEGGFNTSLNSNLKTKEKTHAK